MKTNFLKKVKQLMFLLLAIFGTLAGYSQQTQNPSLNTIGGSKIPGDKGIVVLACEDFDIGGRVTDSGPGLYDTGGNGGKSISVDVTGGLEIGGGKGTSGDTGQKSIRCNFVDSDAEYIITDIGGRDTGGGLGSLSFIEIGGRGGTDTGTGPIEFSPSSITSIPIFNFG